MLMLYASRVHNHTHLSSASWQDDIKTKGKVIH